MAEYEIYKKLKDLPKLPAEYLYELRKNGTGAYSRRGIKDILDMLNIIYNERHMVKKAYDLEKDNMIYERLSIDAIDKFNKYIDELSKMIDELSTFWTDISEDMCNDITIYIVETYQRKKIFDKTTPVYVVDGGVIE
jgi:hypothetical protein